MPYSFGLRTSGSSKLSSKVMLKYVGQLVTLYVWAWGLAFYVVVAAGVTLAVAAGERVLRYRARKLTRGKEYPLGGFHADAGTPPLSPRARGKRRDVSPGAAGAGGGGLAAWVGAATGGAGGGNTVLERKRLV